MEELDTGSIVVIVSARPILFNNTLSLIRQATGKGRHLQKGDTVMLLSRKVLHFPSHTLVRSGVGFSVDLAKRKCNECISVDMFTSRTSQRHDRSCRQRVIIAYYVRMGSSCEVTS
jgi:hypothetical protein